MAQTKKKRYRVRYDRIIFCAVILAILILLMSSCIRSCGKDKQPTDSQPVNSLDDQLETSDTTEAGSTSSRTTIQTSYSTLSKDSDSIHSGDLILVNKEYPCEFDYDAIEEGTSSDVSFVTVKSILDTKESPKHYTASEWEVGLDRTAAYAMDAWFEGFYAATSNRDLRMIGGYRSDAGDPDFRTGRTLTIGIYPESGSSNFYKAEGDYAWLAEHAAEYGFIQRYPEEKDEFFDDSITTRRTATFRYVGVAAATYITENELCLEEYLEAVKEYSIDDMLKIKSGDAEYGVYYIPANSSSSSTNFSVPGDDTPYVVSGNNMDGFVITVALNDAAAETKTATPDYEDLDE